MTTALAPSEHDLLHGQRLVLEMVATDAPLADILAELVRLVEAQEPGARCGILVLAEDAAHFRHGAGPSLPETYHRALEGAPITPPYMGPCSEAVHRGLPVLVPDMANDARWSPTWRELVLSCGLAACHSTPVRSPDGRVLASLAMYYDQPCDLQPRQPQLIEIAIHLAGIAIERQRADTALRESERQARELLMSLPVALYTTDTQGRITFFNQAAESLWGCRPELGRSEWCGSSQLFWPDGEPMRHDECPMAIALQEGRALCGEAVAGRPDGSRVPFLAFPSPLHDSTGALTGAVNMLVDITDRKRAEERRLLLVNELNHRVKNTLSTVLSIASQTLGGAPQLEAFEARLVALSTTHDTLTRNSWQHASLRQLIAQELAPYGGAQPSRCRLQGRDIQLAPKAAVALGMAFHELATNAAKYGALACAAGQVRVEWACHGKSPLQKLHLCWSESGGPPVAPPQRRGFGSRLIERGLAHELGGEVRMDFQPGGLVCTIELPLMSRRKAGHPTEAQLPA